MHWQSDKKWSDRFIPEIKRILGEHLIGTATDEEDQQQNTDLITLRMPGNVRFACRVRKHAYLERYADEFTLRCHRPSGRITEIDKLLGGWGDYLFYGFASADEQHLAAWFIGDLAVFRDWIQGYVHRFNGWPGELKWNHDNSSGFVAFSVHEIGPGFVVKRQVAQPFPHLCA
jgi:hypothetical protein